MFKLIVILLFVSTVAGATVNYHAPIAQLNRKAGFVLDAKRWTVHYPTVWTTESEQVPVKGYITLKTALSRQFKLTHHRVRGGNVWYRISLNNLPEKYRSGENIIEFEFPMPIAKVYAGSKQLKDLSAGSTGLYRRAAKTGRNFLITNPGKNPFISVCVKDFDFRFANHIGQAIIRKSQLSDQLYITKKIIDRPDKYEIVCGINNRLNRPLTGNFIIKTQNYFGKVINTTTVKINLPPNSKTKWVKIKRKSPLDYKIIAEFISKVGSKSPLYMAWFRDAMLTKNHSSLRKYQLLDSNWAAHWVKEQDGFKMPLPTTGWITIFPRKVYPFQGIAQGLPLFWKTQRMPFHRMWVKHSFKTPIMGKNEQLKLYMRGIDFRGEFYLNGHLIKKVHNHSLPGYIDLTARLAPAGAENILAIGITDYIAIRAKDAPKLADGVHGSGNVVDSGPAMTRSVRIGIQRPPVLVLMPNLAVKNIAISTVFVPKKTISTATTVQNSSPTARTVKIHQAIFNHGIKVLDLGSKTVTVPANKAHSITFTQSWSTAIPWEFNNPQLYELRTELDESGKIIDRFSERFGFNSWAKQGRNFFLNNKKIHPYGDGYGMKTMSYYWPVQPTNSRITRIGIGGRGEKWLDIADEVGHATTWEMPMSPFGGMGYRLGEDLIYKNLLQKWRKIIAEDRNHPAIFCYTLGNEPPTADKNICKKMFNHQTAVHQLDPAKMVHFSRGNELMGYSDIYSPHYLYHKNILPTDLNYFDRKKLAQPADNRLKKQHKIGHQYETTWRKWDNFKPVFDSEGASVTDGKEYVAWLFGEEIFARRPDDRGRYSLGIQVVQDAMRARMYDGYRKNGISALLSHIGWRWGDESLSPIIAYFYEDEYRLFSNRTSTRTIRVLNDTLNSETVDVKIRLSKFDQKPLTMFSKTFKLDAGASTDWQITLPKTGCTTPEYIYLSLSANGLNSGYNYHKQLKLTLFPRHKPDTSLFNNVTLFDPAGATAAVLLKAGYRFKVLTKLEADSLTGTDILIIGRNAIKVAEKQHKRINAKVKAGMKVIVLNQELLAYPFPFKVEDGGWFANGAGAVISAPMHSIFKNLLPEDMRFWQNAERVPLVFSNAPFVPLSGNVEPLLAGAKTTYPQQLEFSPLFCADYGQGQFLISQLEIVPSILFDPVAPLIFDNILKYLQGNNKSSHNFATILDKSTALRFKQRYGMKTDEFQQNRLRRNVEHPTPAKQGKHRINHAMCDIQHRIKEKTVACDVPVQQAKHNSKGKVDIPFKINPKYTQTLFISAKAKLPKKQYSQLETLVKNGGILYLQGIDSSRLKMLAEIFKLNVELNRQPSGAAAMIVRDPLFAGLTQYDWVWSRGKTNSRLLLGSRTIKVKTQAAENLLEPAYMVKVPYGKGFIMLDTTNWPTANSKIAQMIAVNLLRNLGARFSEQPTGGKQKAWKKLAAKYHFTPINMTPAVNRGFADDSAGNRQGGWTDQGKGHDIASFPVGNQKFNEIPFYIADPKLNHGNGLVAVKGHSWSNLPAKSTELPVNKKLDKIFFIHGCAWASLPADSDMARYIIYYADRKDWIPGKPLPYTYAPVKNNRHIYDWWFYDKIAKGELTMAEADIAWRDKGNNSNRGVAMMEWTNPYPEREIAAIAVESTSNNAQFFFIGATGANYKAGSKDQLLKPVPVSRHKYPQTLKLFKGKLWQLKTEQFILYLDVAARIKWFGTRNGIQIFNRLGSWIIQTRKNRKNIHLAGQGGNLINKLQVSQDSEGTLTMRLKDISQNLLTWSQTVTITNQTIETVNQMKFKPEFIKAIKDTSCSVSTNATLAPEQITNAGKLLASGNGFIEIPAKNFNISAHFNNKFQRYRGGMWYIDKHASLSVTPTDFNAKAIDLNKTYTTKLTLDLSEQ
jgi:glycosyl hydrolase family 2